MVLDKLQIRTTCSGLAVADLPSAKTSAKTEKKDKTKGENTWCSAARRMEAGWESKHVQHSLDGGFEGGQPTGTTGRRST